MDLRIVDGSVLLSPNFKKTHYIGFANSETFSPLNLCFC